MFVKHSWILGVIFSLCLSMNGRDALAVTLNFESLAHEDGSRSPISATPHTYTESGFQFTIEGANQGNGFATDGTLSASYPGSTALIHNTIARDTVLKKVGGGAFTLSSIDLTTTYIASSGTFDLTFNGTKSDTSLVTHTVTIDNTAYALVSYLFPSSFTNLFAVRWSQGNPSHQFDNAVLDEVSAVPVPAALPLFGTGLAVLGFLGWRRNRMRA